MQQNQKFDEDFKKTILDLNQSGQSVEELAEQYGIATQTIYRWKKLHTKNEATGMTEAEILAMKKEMARMQEENTIPKKGFNHIRSKVKMSDVFEFIQSNVHDHDVKQMCTVLEAPKSSYYDWKKKKPSKRKSENKRLNRLISGIYFENKGIYGAPKIHKILVGRGESLSLKKVQILMRKLGLRSVTLKKYKPGKQVKVKSEGRKNLLNQDFTTTSINQKWVTDITYIHSLKDGWTYLSTIQDLHTKKVIGWKFGKQMTKELVIETLDHALLHQTPSENLIIHSDLGSQYTSEAYEAKLNELNIRHSFSRKGCPYDNAGIESFHASLKKEEVYPSKAYENFEAAHLALFQYIEGFYNRKRIHSSINYLTPNQMEELALQA
ncbi:IS3 family transposase [Enterococcus casseliflavus]|uniref:IS3 family transposase n=1 Tax=Enterococcus casseliflavus TaxID=37734 RepID=UPI0018842893|nr:IS3 family transposase [Enterococcus casseliflavus]MBE9879901.1 IS3 family transposase [Enterococcus casseliflavus]MDT2972322.1 IS3 family transposase [Enterococcus casseliflavus]